MNVSRLLCAAGALLVSAVWAEAYTNVIIVMADDFGYECVEDYGGESYSTPEMSEMALEGVRFEHAHSQPICTPSRVQIMSGKYNVRNYTKFATLDQSQDTFGNPFKNAGYETCIVGKWQLGGNQQTLENFGFDHHCVWRMGSANQERYWGPIFEVDGESKSYPGQYGPDIQQNYVTNFIQGCIDEDKPFFLYYPILLTHSPYQPTPDSAIVSTPGWDSTYWTEAQSETNYFGDMVEYMDKQLGELRDFLEQKGIDDETLLIFTGDNGTGMSIYSMQNGVLVRGGKGQTKESGTRVPLFAAMPGTVQSNLVVSPIVDFSDIYATIMDITDLPYIPGEEDDKDGVSFLPQLKGDAGTPRDHSYCWYMKRTDMTDIRQFVQDETYKLYITGKFYNKTNDVLETTSLADGVLTPGELALKSYFNSLLMQYDALRPDGIPYNNSIPYPIPGKIEAEYYDYGLEGITYHDSTEDSNAGGDKRTDDVDIHTVGGATVIDEISAGEWLEYTVNVETNGTYAIVVRYAAESAGGRLHFEVNGVPVSGTLELPATGSFSTYSTVEINDVQLSGGTRKLTMVFDQPGMSIDRFTASYVGPPGSLPQPPVSATLIDYQHEDSDRNTTLPNLENGGTDQTGWNADSVYINPTGSGDLKIEEPASGGNIQFNLSAPLTNGMVEVEFRISSYDLTGISNIRDGMGFELWSATQSANQSVKMKTEWFTSGARLRMAGPNADGSGFQYPSVSLGSDASTNGIIYRFEADLDAGTYQVFSKRDSDTEFSAMGVPGVCSNITQVRLQTTANPAWPSGTFVNIDYFTLKQILPETGGLVFADWAAQFPTLGALTNSTDNPDGDAFNNLYEFAFGGIPTNRENLGHLPVFQALEDSTGHWFEFVYARRINPEQSGLVYTLEKNTNLVDGIWNSASNELVAVGILDENFEVVTNRFPTAELGAQFIQLQVDEL
ncbi:sulfatase-like hydrolase/transferase [Pontiella agarivorans]|uniref:Sulfatase-like hydrolase/transferase n=1 Tax=Pontiella agarivorans TaxID=3038953 RepID=A0ABU5MY02_9BACT|nr:sulfatase-like hydrolase/transferase [Pontiella agarivorans]MDZ8119060.1 sulfatase-like hydrolase/transferase [Pontiella agarivorans]